MLKYFLLSILGGILFYSGAVCEKLFNIEHLFNYSYGHLSDERSFSYSIYLQKHPEKYIDLLKASDQVNYDINLLTKHFIKTHNLQRGDLDATFRINAYGNPRLHYYCSNRTTKIKSLMRDYYDQVKAYKTNYTNAYNKVHAKCHKQPSNSTRDE